MQSIILDTNVFLRLLLNDIPHQVKEVEKLIKKAKSESIELIVPQIVLFEITFALEKYYLLRKEDIIDKLQTLLSATYFTIESREIFFDALLLYKKYSLSLVDCFLLAKSQLEGAELFTFDQKLQKLQNI